jgi:hypothetical protein
MARSNSTLARKAPSLVLPIPPLTPADLRPGDKVAVWPSWKLGTVESMTGWREDHIQVRWDEPIRSRKRYVAPQTHGYPRAAHCARIGGAS